MAELGVRPQRARALLQGICAFCFVPMRSGMDSRLNDPGWVLFDENGQVRRHNPHAPPNASTGVHVHRGNDSDGSGMM